ncbi:hypothetical protein TIFTF001_006089 [Ficus carica]|uniref:Uncharacterized protein n=1 Tax=Ficus carica TaxID=3494 RepID=A0AA87ZL91_FICCA|nr:hypothetical protein TIFTF001_006089 [Ficus carica]
MGCLFSWISRRTSRPGIPQPEGTESYPVPILSSLLEILLLLRLSFMDLGMIPLAMTISWISDFPYYLPYEGGFGKLANNALHWVVSRKPCSDVSKLVFALDLVTEEYRQVLLPDFTDENLHVNSVNQVLMNKNGEKFMVYDLESKKAKNVKISGAPDNIETELCVESLVRLDGDDDGPFVSVVKNNTSVVFYNSFGLTTDRARDEIVLDSQPVE